MPPHTIERRTDRGERPSSPEGGTEPSDTATDAEAVRFDDPAWDDEFCTWLDNGLRTCCG